MAALDLEAAKGTQVRSHIRWIEEGESSSAFFFRLEKKRAADRLISGLRLDDGSVVNSTSGLLAAFSLFYSKLFSAQPCDPHAQSELLSHVLSSLTVVESSSCEGDLSLEECFAALSGMARLKAPGSDGLPMEFYLKFWPVLGQDLVLVLNSCFSEGRLSLSQRRGVISLSFKKGDCLNPKNWRPISLLNCDYKIASRVIAARLLKVIHLVVEKDQTCGVPGQFIGENVAFLRNVVYYTTLSDVPVALLSLDQEKAFDVDWDFMRATLRHMVFSPSFIGWVNLFYSGVQSAVNVYGHISDFFALSCGVGQGCPLSPLLYVLVAEVLACNIRANSNVPGLSLPGLLSPLPCLSQYADDTSVIACSDQAIVSVFDTYDLYERGSSSKLNLSKSKGLWLGPWNGRSDSHVAIDWSSVKIKVLGVFLGPLDLEEDN